jgi:ABC-type multidrug transport system ATPase subunit
MSGLHADSIRKQYGTRQILNDIFISCKAGELVGLLGRNGSEKSSLLKIIFGTLSADNKFVSVDQKKTGSLFAGRNMIRYLPQDNFLPNHIKIKDLFQCFCNKQSIGLLINNPLIQPHLGKKSAQLSGGEKRLVEILLMLQSEAKYLLLDEPFNGLSPLQIEVVKDLIRAHSSKKGFIITDHDYRNVLNLSSRVVLMDQGNTKMIKDFDELIEFGCLPTRAQILPEVR